MNLKDEQIISLVKSLPMETALQDDVARELHELLTLHQKITGPAKCCKCKQEIEPWMTTRGTLQGNMCEICYDACE